MGSSPATGPTPNRGYEVAAQQGLGVIIHALENLLPKVGSTSDMGKDIMSMIKVASKHVQPGAVTPAAMSNELQKAQLANTQNSAMMQRLMAQKAGGGAGGPQPGMPPGGGGAPPMMPKAA
jgi:hypothetical protein